MASRRETQEVGRVTSFNGLRWNLNENLALRRLAIASEMESKSVLNFFFFAPRLKLCMQPSAVARGWQPTVRLDGRRLPVVGWNQQEGSRRVRRELALGFRIACTGTRDGQILSFCGSISGSQSNARELSTGHTHMLHAVVTRFSSEIRHMAIYIHVRYARRWWWADADGVACPVTGRARRHRLRGEYVAHDLIGCH